MNLLVGILLVYVGLLIGINVSILLWAWTEVPEEGEKLKI